MLMGQCGRGPLALSGVAIFVTVIFLVNSRTFFPYINRLGCLIWRHKRNTHLKPTPVSDPSSVSVPALIPSVRTDVALGGSTRS